MIKLISIINLPLKYVYSSQPPRPNLCALRFSASSFALYYIFVNSFLQRVHCTLDVFHTCHAVVSRHRVMLQCNVASATVAIHYSIWNTVAQARLCHERIFQETRNLNISQWLCYFTQMPNSESSIRFIHFRILTCHWAEKASFWPNSC